MNTNRARLFYFNIDYICNNNCKYCCSKSTRNRLSDIIEIEDIEVLIKKFNINCNDTIVLSGGEPTVSPVFFDIITLLHQVTQKIIVYTNGRLINGIDDNLIGCIQRFIVPVYGLLENHDNYVGVKGAFKETYEGMIRLIKHNVDILELKIVYDSERNFTELVNSSCFKTLMKNNRFSITRLLIQSGEEQIIQKKSLNIIEDEIVYLWSLGKKVKFYDFPFCTFSDNFKTKIRFCYNPELNEMYDIFYCKAGGVSNRISFDKKSDYFNKCLYCHDNIFCCKMMQNYYCPIVYDNTCRLSTE